MVEQWYRETYQLPSNHECFLDRTMQEHLVDMAETLFIKKPLEMHRQMDGEYQFTDTGDHLIDQWEQELADGLVPDLLEAFKPSDLATMDRARKELANGRNSMDKASRSFGDVMEQMTRESQSVANTLPPNRRRRTFGE